MFVIWYLPAIQSQQARLPNFQEIQCPTPSWLCPPTWVGKAPYHPFFCFSVSVGGETPINRLWPKRLSRTFARLLIMADPLWIKTICNVCWLACILGLTNSNRQISLTSKERSTQWEWCPLALTWEYARHHSLRVSKQSPSRLWARCSSTNVPFKNWLGTLSASKGNR